MRRGNLLTLRKFFNWHSNWYNKFQYHDLVLRDTLIYVYLISLFKILKIPTSMFKINHFSSNILYINCDLYVRWLSMIIKYVKTFFLKYSHIWFSLRRLFKSRKKITHTSLITKKNVFSLRSKLLYSKYPNSTFIVEYYILFIKYNEYVTLLAHKFLGTHLLFLHTIWLYFSKLFFYTANLIFYYQTSLSIIETYDNQLKSLFFTFLNQSLYRKYSINKSIRINKKVSFHSFNNYTYGSFFDGKSELVFFDYLSMLQSNCTIYLKKVSFFIQHLSTPIPLIDNLNLTFDAKIIHHFLLKYIFYRLKRNNDYADSYFFFFWFIELSLNTFNRNLLNYYSTILTSKLGYSDQISLYDSLSITFFKKLNYVRFYIFKNSFEFKMFSLICSVSKSFFLSSKMFKFYFLLDFITHLGTKIEQTLFDYLKNNHTVLFLPNYYLLYKPYITSAKLMNDYIFFKLKKRFNLNTIYKSIKIWQIRERSLMFFFFKYKKSLNIKDKSTSMSRSIRFTNHVKSRIPLLGLRIVLTGPPYKARRKIKKFYHLWVANHSITGNMPLQSFGFSIDYYQTFIVLKRASLGLKVWMLFESYKELK